MPINAQNGAAADNEPPVNNFEVNSNIDGTDEEQYITNTTFCENALKLESWQVNTRAVMALNRLTADYVDEVNGFFSEDDNFNLNLGNDSRPPETIAGVKRGIKRSFNNIAYRHAVWQAAVSEYTDNVPWGQLLKLVADNSELDEENDDVSGNKEVILGTKIIVDRFDEIDVCSDD